MKEKFLSSNTLSSPFGCLPLCLPNQGPPFHYINYMVCNTLSHNTYDKSGTVLSCCPTVQIANPLLSIL